MTKTIVHYLIHSRGDLGHFETGLFDTAIILRFVCHLVNDTEINQFPFPTLLLMFAGHP